MHSLREKTHPINSYLIPAHPNRYLLALKYQTGSDKRVGRFILSMEIDLILFRDWKVGKYRPCKEARRLAQRMESLQMTGCCPLAVVLECNETLPRSSRARLLLCGLVVHGS